MRDCLVGLGLGSFVLGFGGLDLVLCEAELAWIWTLVGCLIYPGLFLLWCLVWLVFVVAWLVLYWLLLDVFM